MEGANYEAVCFRHVVMSRPTGLSADEPSLRAQPALMAHTINEAVSHECDVWQRLSYDRPMRSPTGGGLTCCSGRDAVSALQRAMPHVTHFWTLHTKRFDMWISAEADASRRKYETSVQSESGWAPKYDPDDALVADIEPLRPTK